jgi:hypothetical protein
VAAGLTIVEDEDGLTTSDSRGPGGERARLLRDASAAELANHHGTLPLHYALRELSAHPAFFVSWPRVIGFRLVPYQGRLCHNFRQAG